MGDSKRFTLFAQYIFKNFPIQKYTRIADIAGGKGYLQKELCKLGYIVTTYDKRHHHIKDSFLKFKYKYFDKNIKEEYDLLIGLHPDEATDVIITEAYNRKIPFVIVPCCTLPTITKYKGSSNYNSWILQLKTYAKKLGFIVEEYQLKISGKNIVLKGIFK